MTTVEVAVLSTGEAAYDAPNEVLHNASVGQPWLSRTRVSTDASDDMLVGDIVDAAAEKLSVAAKPTWWARDLPISQAAPPLWFPDVRDEDNLTQWDAFVDGEGAARWWFDRYAQPYRHLRIAEEQGVSRADSTRLLISLDAVPGGGGNGLDYWLEVIRAASQFDAAVRVTWSAVEPYVGLGTALVAVQQFAKRRRKRTNLYGGDLRKYGALLETPRTPDEVQALIQADEQDLSDLRTIYGISSTGYSAAERDALFAVVYAIDAAAHAYLPPSALAAGVGAVLSQPPRQVLEGAAEIFQEMRDQALSANEKVVYVSADEDSAKDGHNFRIAVFRDSGEIAGSMSMLPAGGFTVFDSMGAQFLSPDGNPLTFLTMDEASNFIVGQEGRNL